MSLPKNGVLTLEESQPATSDSNGNITFTFGSPPVGFAWQGSLQVPAALPSARFQVLLNGVLYKSFVGTQTFGPFQVPQGSVLSVTGAGLAISMAYTATLSGTQLPLALATGVAPLPVASGPSPESLYSASSFSASVAGSKQLIPASASDQYLIFSASVASFYNSSTAEPYVVAAVVIANAVGDLAIASNTLVAVFAGPNMPGSASATFPGGLVTPAGYGAWLVWVYSSNQESIGSIAAVQIT